MFSLFKSNKEKQLEKLGYKTLLDSYRKKVKLKEWSKTDYTVALEKLYKDKQSIIGNADNINVSTRQSFVDDEVMVALNLQNIQQEYIDYDFIYSSLLYEFKSNKKIHSKAIKELIDLLHSKFPEATIAEEFATELKDKETSYLIDEALQDITSENQHQLKAVFTELHNRL